MVVFRILWAFLTSRWLWTFIGLALLGGVIWLFSPLISVGTAQPFAAPVVRLAIIAGLFILWLIWLIVAQRRAIRANRLFVSELAEPGEAARPGGRRRCRHRRAVPGGARRAQAPQARRPQVAARDAVVRDHRPARRRQDHGAAPVRPRLPVRPDRRPARRRRHPQLRLVLHRGGGADRHRRPLPAAGEPRRGGRRRMARLPRPPEEAPRPPRPERRAGRHPRRRPRRGRRLGPRPRPRDPQAPRRALRAAGATAAGLPARHQGRPRQGLRAELRRPRDRRARAGLGRDLRPRRARRFRCGVAASSPHWSNAWKPASAPAWRPRRSCRPAPRSSASRRRSRASTARSASWSRPPSARAATRRAPGSAAST